jgi:hypothetical protein
VLLDIARQGVEALKAGDELAIAKYRVEVGRQVRLLLSACRFGGYLT